MEETQRIFWSFAAIAIFGVLIYLFHRTKVSRIGIVVPTMLGVAVTMGLTLWLFDL